MPVTNIENNLTENNYFIYKQIAIVLFYNKLTFELQLRAAYRLLFYLAV